MARLMVVVGGLVAAATLGCAPQASSRTAEAAAAMLFASYETVVKAEVSVLPFSAFGGQNEDPRVFLALPFGFLFAALDAASPKAAERAMSQTATVLVGVKDFRGPRGLGSVSSRNCHVLIVKRAFDLARVLGKPATETWEGAPVWRWTASLHEFGELDDRPSAIAAVQIPPYVLVSNDPDTLFANARALKAGSTEALRGLTEWPDTVSHDYWGYRRFRFDAPDPLAAGITGLQRDLESLLLFYDRTPESATLRVVTRAGAGKAPVPLDEDGRLPPLKPISATASQGPMPLTIGSTEHEAWFIALGLLGFAIYL